MKANLLGKLTAVFRDPPPELAFEISERGVSMARTKDPANIRFEEMPPGTVAASPVANNVLDSAELAQAIARLAPAGNMRRRRRAALVLPDYSARISVLEFDSLPDTPEEQLALVRFRLKKSIPFDIESAALSYSVQPGAEANKKEVVAAVTPLEVIARYEVPFRARGIQTGFVTLSPLAALELVPGEGISVLAKLNGRILTILVTEGAQLKLVRTLELAEIALEEISTDIYPTFVYIEDRFGVRGSRLLLCGFGSLESAAIQRFHAELEIPVAAAHSRLAPLSGYNAGLLGYLEGAAA